jgi:starch synthase (maltosyl-transferring)
MQYTMDKRRVVIEKVQPEIDDGRFPIKRTPGETVRVEVDIFTDGHEALSAALLYRPDKAAEWTEVTMTPLVNDRWEAEFRVTQLGRYLYTIVAWLDHFKFWSKALAKRVEAGQDVSVEMLIGANLVEAATKRAEGEDAQKLEQYAQGLKSGTPEAIEQALSAELSDLMYRYGGRVDSTTYEHELAVTVDPRKARFCAWYEFFPRSLWNEQSEGHGTFKDAEDRLSYVAELGFDIVYLPPIHPIGMAFRKGKNNNTVSRPDDVGSPWAIGGEEGGHKSIHSQLGTLNDFRSLVRKARDYGIDIAMDIAFQSSPDHPYVKEHPEWFRRRPDGTIQYAENPPKKYEDIYPFDFESPHWKEMWEELRSVILYWIEQGVRVFRVDNPHTKPFHMWEWIIGTIKEQYPDTIFLAEAFTRPKVMYYLAKSGFTQSYTYFAWRNTKWELTEYMTELTRTEVREYFRPNFWPNTPDILTEALQVGGRPAFIVRFILAATLTASYGMYGPAYEMQVYEPIAIGKEEYRDSEKYEIKHWNIDDPSSLRPIIAAVNSIRRDNPAMQSNEGLHFCNTTNENIIAYYKATTDLSNIVLTVVNLDYNYTQAGMVELPIEDLGIDPNKPYQVHDLLTDNRYMWSGRSNYVELDPHNRPAHIFSLRRRIRTEQDFDYYQ